MRYEIHGTVMQTLDVYLTQGESMYTESGGMAWMKGNVEMKTNTKGGLMAGLGRKLAGESLFMTPIPAMTLRRSWLPLLLKHPAKSSRSNWVRVRALSARRMPLCARRTRWN
jgi:hypothetical protein